MEKVLKAGHFAFTGELGPPRGCDVEEVREKAQHLKGNVDFVNITDNQVLVRHVQKRSSFSGHDNSSYPRP